jgi:hypothetical protein
MRPFPSVLAGGSSSRFVLKVSLSVRTYSDQSLGRCVQAQVQLLVLGILNIVSSVSLLQSAYSTECGQADFSSSLDY